jgi:Mlc titration factor MtfA (ptsG expression regulator)
MGWLTDWRRRRVLSRHRMDDALWKEATRGLRFLPASEKLKSLVLLFLAEKEFSGVHGIEVSDAMRVSIAAQACLPILELGLDWYSGWTGVVVYPGDFRVRRTEVDDDGVVHEWDDELAGEAMPGGPVVLSWDAAANDPHMNVVIHEFAHKLDMLDNVVNGTPPLHRREDSSHWYEVCTRELALLRAGDGWPLRDYGGTDPGEFFAVATEAFFDLPAQLEEAKPDLYRVLRAFYRQDPAARARRRASGP